MLIDKDVLLKWLVYDNIFQWILLILLYLKVREK